MPAGTSTPLPSQREPREAGGGVVPGDQAAGTGASGRTTTLGAPAFAALSMTAFAALSMTAFAALSMTANPQWSVKANPRMTLRPGHTPLTVATGAMRSGWGRCPRRSGSRYGRVRAYHHFGSAGAPVRPITTNIYPPPPGRERTHGFHLPVAKNGDPLPGEDLAAGTPPSAVATGATRRGWGRCLRRSGRGSRHGRVRANHSLGAPAPSPAHYDGHVPAIPAGNPNTASRIDGEDPRPPERRKTVLARAPAFPGRSGVPRMERGGQGVGALSPGIRQRQQVRARQGGAIPRT